VGRPRDPFVAFTKHLYDDVLRGQWTANQLKIVLAVIRWTLGNHDRVDGDQLSIRHLAKSTGVHERTVRLVLEGLITEGVIVCVRPAKGRRAATLRLETDAHYWGAHAPESPPLRKGANHENLTRSQFSAGSLSASGLPHKTPTNGAADLCASGRAPLAGVHSRTDCGSGLADSEEREERSLKDGGSSAEAPPPSTDLKSFELPGWGPVYEGDTWALHQDDATREQYLRTFGPPRRRALHNQAKKEAAP
jgi:hypothetical protein